MSEEKMTAEENLWDESLRSMVEKHVDNPDARGVIALYHRKSARQYHQTQLQQIIEEVEEEGYLEYDDFNEGLNQGLKLAISILKQHKQ